MGKPKKSPRAASPGKKKATTSAPPPADVEEPKEALQVARAGKKKATDAPSSAVPPANVEEAEDTLQVARAGEKVTDTSSPTATPPADAESTNESLHAARSGKKKATDALTPDNKTVKVDVDFSQLMATINALNAGEKPTVNLETLGMSLPGQASEVGADGGTALMQQTLLELKKSVREAEENPRDHSQETSSPSQSEDASSAPPRTPKTALDAQDGSTDELQRVARFQFTMPDANTPLPITEGARSAHGTDSDTTISDPGSPDPNAELMEQLAAMGATPFIPADNTPADETSSAQANQVRADSIQPTRSGQLGFRPKGRLFRISSKDILADSGPVDPDLLNNGPMLRKWLEDHLCYSRDSMFDTIDIIFAILATLQYDEELAKKTNHCPTVHMVAALLQAAFPGIIHVDGLGKNRMLKGLTWKALVERPEQPPWDGAAQMIDGERVRWMSIFMADMLVEPATYREAKITRTVPARNRVRMLLRMSYQERPFCTIQRESIYEYYCKLCKPTAEDYPPVDQDIFWEIFFKVFPRLEVQTVSPSTVHFVGILTQGAPHAGDGIRMVEQYQKSRVSKLAQKGLIPVGNIVCPKNKFAEMCARNPMLMMSSNMPDPLAGPLRKSRKKAEAQIKLDEEADAKTKAKAEAAAKVAERTDARIKEKMTEAMVQATIAKIEAGKSAKGSKGHSSAADNVGTHLKSFTKKLTPVELKRATNPDS